MRNLNFFHSSIFSIRISFLVSSSCSIWFWPCWGGGGGGGGVRGGRRNEEREDRKGRGEGGTKRAHITGKPTLKLDSFTGGISVG